MFTISNERQSLSTVLDFKCFALCLSYQHIVGVRGLSFFFPLYSRTPALIHFILKDNGNATLTPTVVATFVGNRQTDKRRLSVCYQNNPINYEEILMTSSGTVGQDDYILAVFRILPKIKVQGACLTAD